MLHECKMSESERKGVAALFIEERRTPPWHLADLSGAESAYSYVVLSTYHTCHIIQWLIPGVAQSLQVRTFNSLHKVRILLFSAYFEFSIRRSAGVLDVLVLSRGQSGDGWQHCGWKRFPCLGCITKTFIMKKSIT